VIRASFTHLLATAALLTAALLPTACSDDAPDDKFASFDRKGMLQNLGSNVMLPAFAEFAAKTDSLVVQVIAFTQQQTPAEFAKTQAMWLRTASSYKRCEVYQFGPLNSTAVADINFWPARTASIETLVSSQNVTEASLTQQGATVKGLTTLEYLLYNGGPTAYNRFSPSMPDSDRGRAYLLALAQVLRTSAHQVRDGWQSSYAATYPQQDGQTINSSINVTANALISYIDFIKNSKVGIPAGKKDGNLHPEQVEAYYSGASLPQLLNNLTAMERLFTGAGPAGSTGPGFNALLDHLEATYNGQSLSAAIMAQLADCRAKAQALGPGPLSEAVRQNPAGVTALYDSLKQLLVLTKVDMVSAIGVTLTFSDNDGD
jgi:predicted lipoprotein